MTKGEPTTFLGRHTTLANGDSHYKGYNGNQVVSEFINTRTNTTARNLSTHHFHLKNHKIHHPDKQIKAK